MRKDSTGGEIWLNELRDLALPMLESYDVVLCQTPAGYVCDRPYLQPSQVSSAPGFPTP
jgi:hypothetical protein